MRVRPAPYTEADPNPIVQAVAARRGGKFLELDKALMNSLPYTEGWNVFIGKVRTGLKLPGLYRELAMCAVAGLCGADYEMNAHGPLYLKEGGTPERLAALGRLKTGIEPVFTLEEKALLQLTVEMTQNVSVSDQTFEAARAVLGHDQELVEYVGVVSAYNMVARFLVALKV